MPIDTFLPVPTSILRSTPNVLRALLSNQPRDVLARPNPEGWSIKDIVAHLVDVEEIAFNVRIRRILDEDQPFIRSIDPDARLASGGFAARSLDDLLVSLARQRDGSLSFLDSLADDQWLRAGIHDSAGRISPRDLVHQWAFHDLAHIRQIMEMLQALVVPDMGATRSFYPEATELFSHQ